MNRVVAIHPAGHWDRSVATDHVTLDHDARHRRRFAFTGAHGTPFLLDEPEAVTLADGAGLELDDGRLIAVAAAAEPLMEVRGRDAAHLMRLAWHVGNRHLAAELTAETIRLRRDHVIAAMLRGLGAVVLEIEAPFSPESGAYAPREAGGHGHGHADGHHHHAHDHHEHGHAH